MTWHLGIAALLLLGLFVLPIAVMTQAPTIPHVNGAEITKEKR